MTDKIKSTDERNNMTYNDHKRANKEQADAGTDEVRMEWHRREPSFVRRNSTFNPFKPKNI